MCALPNAKVPGRQAGIRQGVSHMGGPEHWATPYLLGAHVDETLAADGEELLPVRLLHLIREATQEVVQP